MAHTATAASPLSDPELDRLYADFDHAHLNPLWTQLDSLMSGTPSTQAVPFVWKGSTLHPLAQRAGDLVPVGRSGGRRAVALANPGLRPLVSLDTRASSPVTGYRWEHADAAVRYTNPTTGGPAALVSYISHIVTLQPGDVVITGTTGGVGHARKPPRHIGNGQTVEVSIDGLGTVRNKTIVK